MGLAVFLRALSGTALAASLLACAAAATAATSDVQVKTAFVYNVLRFVAWPRTTGALQLCAVGDDALAAALPALAGKPLEGLRIEVRPLGARASLAQCDAVYLASSVAPVLEDVLARLDGQAVLTIGDAPGFAAQGVIVNFYTEQEKVRFEVNVGAARRAGMKIAAQLLSLARIVEEKAAR